ncbi:TPA: hypothetical protein ACE8V6_000927, partial [Neisseria gonorrhoeae]
NTLSRSGVEPFGLDTLIGLPKRQALCKSCRYGALFREVCRLPYLCFPVFGNQERKLKKNVETCF